MRWRLGILAAVILAVLSLYPQAALIYSRGSEYNGAAFVNDNDESVYLAYLQSLIDERPRKNNIYSGGEIAPSETFLSIQSLPAYAVTMIARPFGFSAETVFPLLSFLFAFSTAIFLYWLFYQFTENEIFSAVAVLFVLVLGVTVAGYGTAKLILGLGPASASFPFLRRYTPGIAFPFLFIFMGSVYRAYAGAWVRRWTWVVASLSFIVLLYSYFYLWTAALAWMAAVVFLTLLFPSLRAKRLFQDFWVPLTISCVLAGLPYLWLLSQRSSSTDSFQALEATRIFVWQRPSIWLGVFLVSALAFLRRRLAEQKLASERLVFATACAILPILVFEQHIITSYSLQPFHYNLYVAPYIVLIAAASTFWLWLKDSRSSVGKVWGVVLISLLSAWGVVESRNAMDYRWNANIIRDKNISVSLRLRRLVEESGEVPGSAISFNSNSFQADHQPSVTPQGVLWSEHLPWASAIGVSDAKRRYFSHLYFTGRDGDTFEKAMKECPTGPECKAIFGWRVIQTLAIGNHSPTQAEAAAIAQEYREFLSEVSSSGPPEPTLSFAVIENREKAFDFANLDRWYQRDAGETVGSYTIYRLTRRKVSP